MANSFPSVGEAVFGCTLSSGCTLSFCGCTMMLSSWCRVVVESLSSCCPVVVELAGSTCTRACSGGGDAFPVAVAMSPGGRGCAACCGTIAATTGVASCGEGGGGGGGPTCVRGGNHWAAWVSVMCCTRSTVSAKIFFCSAHGHGCSPGHLSAKCPGKHTAQTESAVHGKKYPHD